MICLYLCLCLNRYQLRSMSVLRQKGERKFKLKMEEHMKGNAYVRAFQEFFLRFKVYVPEQTPSYSFSFPGKSHRVKL